MKNMLVLVVLGGTESHRIPVFIFIIMWIFRNTGGYAANVASRHGTWDSLAALRSNVLRNIVYFVNSIIL